ncbi:MAG: prephenate dehydrogenase/arogenate dehydrogenase family protein [Candidatus Omnitrophica bacterium]|nr:prephenate dehydrogenase/arogenate dehydrogenase family protein [Candidatus Omnitrophota bacterium]HOX54969.1 prephenate dehydrogenase/arogenate dehydrogenase family protein [Candidatus Omnitrophota bacterium]
MKKDKFLFNQVTIIGVGLIGGSLGMAIKKNRLARRVVGFPHRKATIRQALKLKVIDKGTLELKEAVKDADLVVLATSTQTIVTLAQKILKLAKKNCIITDVGSSKLAIVSSIEKRLPKDIKFVGGHPLAGSEKKGVEFASADIFKQSLCILTPTSRTDRGALNKIKKLWISVGASVKTLTPQNHDRILAYISHLPHIIAFSLIQSIPEEFLKLSPRGLKDMTRIASSDPVLWRDIFSSNKRQVLNAVGAFLSSLETFVKLVSSNDAAKLTKILSAIKNKRDKLE